MEMRLMRPKRTEQGQVEANWKRKLEDGGTDHLTRRIGTSVHFYKIDVDLSGRPQKRSRVEFHGDSAISFAVPPSKTMTLFIDAPEADEDAVWMCGVTHVASSFR